MGPLHVFTHVTGVLSSRRCIYSHWYDEVIKDIPRKVKCVDDTLLYDSSIEEAFYHIWDFLTLCAEKGIRINADKSNFAERLLHLQD